jgi:hypothetical protein
LGAHRNVGAIELLDKVNLFLLLIWIVIDSGSERSGGRHWYRRRRILCADVDGGRVNKWDNWNRICPDGRDMTPCKRRYGRSNSAVKLGPPTSFLGVILNNDKSLE